MIGVAKEADMARIGGGLAIGVARRWIGDWRGPGGGFAIGVARRRTGAWRGQEVDWRLAWPGGGFAIGVDAGGGFAIGVARRRMARPDTEERV